MDKSSLIWICLVIFGTCTVSFGKNWCDTNQTCAELRTFGRQRYVSPCRCYNYKPPCDEMWKNSPHVMTYMGGTELTEDYKFFQLKFCRPIFNNKPLCERSNRFNNDPLIVIGGPNDYFDAKPECSCPNNTYKLTRLHKDWHTNVSTYFFSCDKPRLPDCEPNHACTELHIGVDKPPLDYCVCPNQRVPACDDNVENSSNLAMTFQYFASNVKVQLKFCNDVFQNKPDCNPGDTAAIVMKEGNAFAHINAICRCPKDLSLKLLAEHRINYGDRFYRREYTLWCQTKKKRTVRGKISTRRTTYGNPKDMTLEATVPLDPLGP